MFYSGVEIKMKIEIKAIDILKLKNLKLELQEVEVNQKFLIQEYIDSIELEKLIAIEKIYKSNQIKIKALNKRIVLLTRYIQGGF